MELHLHLSYAFRSLDHKWGKPVDLDKSLETEAPCVPAVIEKPVTTFSSEEYLKSIKRSRPKPYSRFEERRQRKKNVKNNDSFSNISIPRIPSVSDLGGSVTSLDTRSSEDEISLFGVMDDLIEDLERPLEDQFGAEENVYGSTDTLDSEIKRKKGEVNSILKELKGAAISFVEKKYLKKMRKLRR